MPRLLRFPVIFPTLMIFAAMAGYAAEQPAGWPEFRGPSGNGNAEGAALPLTWSETEHVAWKTPIPLKGWSTPVAMEGKIWLTTAAEEGNDFYAIGVEAATGAIFYNEKLFHCDTPEPLGNNVNSYASPSPAMEAGRVYVHFGSYGTACLDASDGKVIWKREDLPCRHYRGPGSSIILFENLLILTFDGADRQYLTALDKASGKTVWSTDRSTKWNDLDAQGNPEREGDFRKAFSTPLIIDVQGKPQMISAGSKSAFSYDPRTGKELWSFPCEAYSPAVRPVYGDGLVYIFTGRGHAELCAVRPDGAGDISATNAVWRMDGRDIPTEPSPVFVDGLLFFASNDGILSCVEASTGTQLWRERIGGNYEASPVYTKDRVYFFSTQGKALVIKPGRVFEKLAENQLETGMMASPAVLGNAFLLRTKTHLYRIEDNAAPK